MTDNKLYFAGLDIGSLSTETVIIDKKQNIAASTILSTGANAIAAAEKSLNLALEKAEIKKEHIHYIIATGYGRVNIPFSNKTVTEITCHGRGAYHFFPNTLTIIDIGGQDSKVIKLDASGKVTDFLMNDKCAAGTGRFLEVMAKTLETHLEDLGGLSLRAKKKLSISSMCTVFAESEVVSLIGQGETKEDIAYGLHHAISQRVVAMAKQIGIANEVTMTGGVAKNKGVVAALEEKIGCKINIPEEPQIIGALGAALLALEQCLREKS